MSASETGLRTFRVKMSEFIDKPLQRVSAALRGQPFILHNTTLRTAGPVSNGALSPKMNDEFTL